jgi:hypothetical protein
MMGESLQNVDAAREFLLNCARASAEKTKVTRFPGFACADRSTRAL